MRLFNDCYFLILSFSQGHQIILELIVWYHASSSMESDSSIALLSFNFEIIVVLARILNVLPFFQHWPGFDLLSSIEQKLGFHQKSFSEKMNNIFISTLNFYNLLDGIQTFYYLSLIFAQLCQRWRIGITDFLYLVLNKLYLIQQSQLYMASEL